VDAHGAGRAAGAAAGGLQPAQGAALLLVVSGLAVLYMPCLQMHCQLCSCRCRKLIAWEGSTLIIASCHAPPPQEGHPRHANGDSEEGEDDGNGGNGNGNGGGGGGGSKGKEGRAEAPAGPSGAASGAQQGLQQQVAAMQAQLEEQGRLLRELCARLAPAASVAGSGGITSQQ